MSETGELTPRLPHTRTYRSQSGVTCDMEVDWRGRVIITEEALHWLITEAGWEEVAPS